MLQQLACVAAGAVGDLGARQHTRDFFDASGAIEFIDIDERAAVVRFFLHDEMIVCEARDLRLMRHAQDLIRF
jgi:hypothetical protein